MAAALTEDNGEHFRQSRLNHDPRTRIALFLLNELVSALRANDPGTFKCWLRGGVEDLGKSVVDELLL